MQLADAFGRVLRKCRKEAGLSQEALGLEAELERNFVSLLERGHRQPSLGTVFKLAKPLKLRPNDLVTMTEAELLAHSSSKSA